MDAHTLPGKRCTTIDLDSIRCTIQTASSLEAALVGVCEPPGRRLTFIRMEDDARPLLLGLVRCANGSEVFFSLPAEKAAAGHTLFDPAQGVQILADTGGPILDEEWLARRDHTLKIRARKGLDALEMVVAPRCAIALILSYALAEFGQVNISRDEWLDRSGGTHEGLRLDLSYLGDEGRPGIGETIWIDWKKFSQFALDGVASGTKAVRLPR